MAAKTPLALVQEKFGDKAKLVEAVEKLTGEDLWVSRTNKEKGLAHVSNAKLLRLHSVFTEVKARFGTREKLIEAILELEKRGKTPASDRSSGPGPCLACSTHTDRPSSEAPLRRRPAPGRRPGA